MRHAQPLFPSWPELVLQVSSGSPWPGQGGSIQSIGELRISFLVCMCKVLSQCCHIVRTQCWELLLVLQLLSSSQAQCLSQMFKSDPFKRRQSRIRSECKQEVVANSEISISDQPCALCSSYLCSQGSPQILFSCQLRLLFAVISGSRQ